MIGRKEEDKLLNSDLASMVIIEEHNPIPNVPVKRYSKGKLLGKGGFAKCYEFTSLDTKRVYAAKVIEKSTLIKSNAKDKLTSEIKIHKSLKYQYVVGFQHFFEDSDNVYILLELCPHQTLNQLIKRRRRITQIEAQCYLYQLALALKYLHSNRIIHRDLKLGNLFLSDKLQIKIGDFGLAAKLENDQEKRRTICGTPNYIAPEILQKNKNGHSYEADIWSFGVVAYAMLVGKPPFQTNDVNTTYKKIRMCNYSFPDSIEISKTAKNFISKMLQLDPARRMNVDQVLSHEFFTTNPFPKTLPISTLACPPNGNFMKQFKKQSLQQSQRLGISGSRFGPSTDRMQSIPRQNLLASKQRNNTQQQTDSVPQRAASSAALVNHHKLAALKKRESLKQSVEAVERHGPDVWVTHYQNNPRFGMCYLLNSNIVGMNFNDKTCLVSNPVYTKVKYMQRIGEDNCQVFQIDSESVPPKKMKLLNHFNKQLRVKRDVAQNRMGYQQRVRSEKLKHKKDTDYKFYVSKYLIVPKASFFWFVNKDLQVIFQDATEMLIRNQQVVYVDKISERKYFLFQNYQSMGDEIKKRIKYINQIVKTSRSVPLKSSDNNIQNMQSTGSYAQQAICKSTMLRSTSSRGRFPRTENA